VIPHYDLSGINIPTKLVGGDYYDCIPLADGRYALVMADVAGKGVPAALLVSSFHAYLSAYLESSVSLVDLTKRLNTVIYRASTEERYITAILALFNPVTGELESTNAGHTPMYLLRDGGAFHELGKGGLALGMMDMEFPYETDSVVLGRGDRLLLFTDGVSEAMNAAGTLYDGDGALREFVLRHRPDRSETFIHGLIADIQQFVGSAPQADDITALYLIRRPASCLT
jgi:sigma-B regulation protein RsbU (phosphoserine phosphatase)